AILRAYGRAARPFDAASARGGRSFARERRGEIDILVCKTALERRPSARRTSAERGLAAAARTGTRVAVCRRAFARRRSVGRRLGELKRRNGGDALMELHTATPPALADVESVPTRRRASSTRRDRRVRLISQLVRAGKYDFESKLAAAIPKLLRDV